jgi:hypothetical protein
MNLMAPFGKPGLLQKMAEMPGPEAQANCLRKSRAAAVSASCLLDPRACVSPTPLTPPAR